MARHSSRSGLLGPGRDRGGAGGEIVEVRVRLVHETPAAWLVARDHAKAPERWVAKSIAELHGNADGTHQIFLPAWKAAITGLKT
jgi:hypothetical protein